MHIEQLKTTLEVEQDEKHKLFVEGNDSNGFDRAVLQKVLNNLVKIESMGPSYHIKSVAQALYPSHPTYYFLVDRDDEPDSTVDKSWDDFPDPDSNNLLYWRCKELENYFLSPNFICSSPFFAATKNEYIKKLEEEATKRVYLDAANLAIAHLRYKLNSNWIKCIKGLEKCKNRESALATLKILNSACSSKKEEVNRLLTEENLVATFEEKLDFLLGGEEICRMGKGRWIEFMSGKELLKVMVNGSMFKVTNREGKLLQGDEKLKQLCLRLIKSGKSLPEDFCRLKNLIKNRIDSN